MWVAFSSLYMFYALALLSIAGVIVLRKRKVPVYPLVALIAIVFITITIMFGQNRYRASAEPALALLAAVAVDAALRRWWPGATAPTDVPRPEAVAPREPATV